MKPNTHKLVEKNKNKKKIDIRQKNKIKKNRTHSKNTDNDTVHKYINKSE